MKNFDTMLVGFDHSHGDPAVLIVGRKAPGDNVRIINQFQDWVKLTLSSLVV